MIGVSPGVCSSEVEDYSFGLGHIEFLLYSEYFRPSLFVFTKRTRKFRGRHCNAYVVKGTKFEMNLE